MSYIVSRQYANDSEIVFACFHPVEEAKRFISAKAAVDENLELKIVYRLYQNRECKAEYNPWDLEVTGDRLPYIEDVGYSIEPPEFPFKIIKNLPHNFETVLAEFDNEADAKLYLDHKLAQDVSTDTDATYHLYNSEQEVDQFDSDTYQKTQQQQAQSDLFFCPAPFPTAVHITSTGSVKKTEADAES